MARASSLPQHAGQSDVPDKFGNDLPGVFGFLGWLMSIVWEQRWHPLREEWILFTSHRDGRPWIGNTHAPEEKRPPSHDPTCALCAGVKRLSGVVNPPYTGAWGFTNDLPCFGGSPDIKGDDFYQARPALGTAEVVCYHPDHAKTFVAEPELFFPTPSRAQTGRVSIQRSSSTLRPLHATAQMA